MAVRMTVQEARDGLADALNRVAYGQERVVVERRGKPVAAIVSLYDLKYLEELEAREDAEDIADHIAAMEEAREKGTIPLEEFIRLQDAKP
jgi:prevent-host-death family protein